jgi:CMP/dCMP kinase
MIVAIDGPAASGKGTLAKRIAAHFGLAHLDTGLLYRAVARDVLSLGGALDDP